MARGLALAAAIALQLPLLDPQLRRDLGIVSPNLPDEAVGVLAG